MRACMLEWSHQMEKSSCKDVAQPFENERATTVTVTVISIKHQRHTTKSKVWKANYDGLIIRQWKLVFSFLHRAKVIVRLACMTRHHLHNTQVYTSPCILSKHTLNAHTYIFIVIILLSFTFIILVAVCVHVACFAVSCFFASPYRLAKWMLSYSYQEYNDVIYDCVWISWVAVHSCDMRLSITSPFFFTNFSFYPSVLLCFFSISCLRILYRQ